MHGRVTRREMLGSVALFTLLDLVRSRGACAEPRGSSIGRWLEELDQLSRDCRAQKLEQTQWQTRVEALLSGMDLREFLARIDIAALGRKLDDFRVKGALSLAVDLRQEEGSTRWVFGRQIFGLHKGRSIVPHGHNNMATAFVVLSGALRGRHYQRLETEPAHMVITPTIDRRFAPGDSSSISDVKDNVHWFQALTAPAFVFNVHVLGVTAGSSATPGRVYIDPAGEKIGGGRIRARLINYDECTRRYG